MSFGAFGVAGGVGGGVSQDKPLVSPFMDSVQCLAWSPTANYLVAGCWDGSLRVWQVDDQGNSQALKEKKHKQNGAVLDVCWDPTGARIFSASCDKSLMMWDINTDQFTQVGAHDLPVKGCRWCPTLNAVMTGSWDKTLKFWNCQSDKPVHVEQLPERCYALDVVNNLAVVACAQYTDPATRQDVRKVCIYSLQPSGVTPFKQVDTMLKMQTRCIACFPAGDGFAVGSIEGRVAVQYPMKEKDNFSFKCHRDTDLIHTVNGIAFHPTFGTFATCGSDGKFVFWDKDARNRLKNFTDLRPDGPITCCGFNFAGNLFAYAQSYDWSKGHQFYRPNKPNNIVIHITPPAEIQKKRR